MTRMEHWKCGVLTQHDAHIERASHACMTSSQSAHATAGPAPTSSASGAGPSVRMGSSAPRLFPPAAAACPFASGGSGAGAYAEAPPAPYGPSPRPIAAAAAPKAPPAPPSSPSAVCACRKAIHMSASDNELPGAMAPSASAFASPPLRPATAPRSRPGARSTPRSTPPRGGASSPTPARSSGPRPRNLACRAARVSRQRTRALNARHSSGMHAPAHPAPLRSGHGPRTPAAACPRCACPPAPPCPCLFPRSWKRGRKRQLLSHQHNAAARSARMGVHACKHAAGVHARG